MSSKVRPSNCRAMLKERGQPVPTNEAALGNQVARRRTRRLFIDGRGSSQGGSVRLRGLVDLKSIASFPGHCSVLSCVIDELAPCPNPERQDSSNRTWMRVRTGRWMRLQLKTGRATARPLQSVRGHRRCCRTRSLVFFDHPGRRTGKHLRQ